jgi:O-antigen ligase
MSCPSAIAAQQAATHAPVKISSFFSAFAVFLALSLIGGFLNYLHEPPSGDFHGEWFAFVFFLCATGFLLPNFPRRFPVSPTLLIWPFVLALLLGLQFSLGFFVYAQSPAFWIGYLALAVLAMVAGQGIRAAGLTREVGNRLAWALVIAALLNTASQVAQATRSDAALAPFVFRLVEGRVCSMYGNVGQSNLTSLLAWLGLASALYLHGVGRLAARWSLPIVAVLLIGSALTASRMAWLFLGVTGIFVVVLHAWPARDRRTRWLTAAMLACGFMVATLAASKILAGFDPSCASGIERLTTRQDGGMQVRLGLWQQAIEVWRTSPWIGVGAYKFLPTAYSIGPQDMHRPLDNYVHNGALQIFAEFGIVGVATLASVIGFWSWRLAKGRRDLDATDALFLLWISVIGVHSMLEFPLWYTQFLVLFCLALGMIVRPEWSSSALLLPLRLPMLALIIFLLTVAAAVFYDYRKLDRLYWLEDQRRAFMAVPTEEIQALLAGARSDVHLFRAQADHLLGLAEPVSKEDLQRKIASTDRLLAHSTQPWHMAKRVALSVLAGDLNSARWHMRRTFGFFPRDAEQMAELIQYFLQAEPEALAALKPVLAEELARRPPPRW